MRAVAALWLGLTLSAAVHAGAQLEEPLADKVRSLLADVVRSLRGAISDTGAADAGLRIEVLERTDGVPLAADEAVP